MSLSLSCPRCGSATRPGQKFCADCGVGLIKPACPSCGAAYEGNPRFCAECGDALAVVDPADPSRGDTEPVASAEGSGRAPGEHAERRHVSVLFCDLVGFTPMSERRDPEEIGELQSAYFAVAREVIERYGGTVEKFIGDAVMAVWGAPVAQEDDAERAVRAALELVVTVPTLSTPEQLLELRAAVMTGEAAVVPGRISEGMVAGDLVNTASRLQSAAPAGSVLVGATTYQATSAAIAYEPAGEQVLKGKQAPVAAWRALRVVAQRGGVRRGQGMEPPFVGRDEELRLLKDQLHAAGRDRRLRLVSVTGQAGIGKSRLVWELLKYVDGLSEGVYWHEGRSPSYGEGITYWALGDMVRRRANIVEGEDDVAMRDKLHAVLAEFVPDEAERRWLAPALGALLGVGEVDWDAREQLFAAWRTFFERISERGTTTLVFEDLQWADSGLLDFIEHLLEWTRDRPILVVTLARPEILDRRPDWGSGKRSLLAVHLEPLPDEPMARLLSGLVPDLPDADRERIIERAEGIPLYAVEMVRSLVDGGYLVRDGDTYAAARELPPLDVPPTLRALIASRLDALAGADRTLLQDAAVLGVVFSTPALAALAERPEPELTARLRALAQRELVALEVDPRSPERGQYRFVQGLIREVAYGTLARRDRRTRHLAAARYFEGSDDEALAGVLASHYIEAYRAAPEGPEGAAVAAQARVALRAAAERAARLHSHEQALVYLEQAMAVTFDETDKVGLRLAAARAATRAAGRADQAEMHLREAIDWYAGTPDQAALAATRAQLGSLLLNESRVDEGMALLEEALRTIPADADDTFVQVQAQIARGQMFRGQPDKALESSSRALEVAERRGLVTAGLDLIITRSWALKLLRRDMEANALLWGATRLADAQDELEPRIRARINLSSYLSTDDLHAARRVADEGIELATQFGLGAWAPSLAANSASVSLAIGDMARVLELAEEFGETGFLAGWAAAAAGMLGDDERADALMAKTEMQLVASSSLQDVSGARYAGALVAFGRGEVGEARRLARASFDAYVGDDAVHALVLAAHTGLLLGDAASVRTDLERWHHGGRGAWLDRSRRTIDIGLLALEGRRDDARAAYPRVIDDWRAADLPFDLALALLERARLLGASDPDAAAGHAEARSIFARIGAHRVFDRLEATTSASTPARQARPRPPASASTAVAARNDGSARQPAWASDDKRPRRNR